MERKPERLLKIRFNADTSSTMQWKFKPQQSEVKVCYEIIWIVHMCVLIGQQVCVIVLYKIIWIVHGL